jgi:Ca2+-binding RTX toxin-like protein
VAAQLRADDSGVKVVSVDSKYRTITAAVPDARLSGLSKTAGVEYVGEVLAPMTNAAVPQCGSTVSEGDAQLNADDARANYGVDGTGVKVGILSDSYNRWAGAHTHAAGDVAAGELPGTAYPCPQGPHTPVDVLDDSASGSLLDEGRGMAQLVHDLAPGADLGFHTAFIDDLNFAQGIIDLKNAGAKVIADDVSYFNEPFFQEGPIANAVTTVNAAGTIEFSSAANSNLIVGGNNISSWEAPAYRPVACPPGIPAYESSCMDFNPGAGTDANFNYTVKTGGRLRIDFQWAQPWYGVTTDFDIFILNASNNTILDSSEGANVTSQQPFEFVDTGTNNGADRNVRVVIARYTGVGGGDTGTPRLKTVLIGSSKLSNVDYPTSNGGDIVGPTIFGHNGGKNAVSVAAVPYNNSATVEDYSSRGPVTHYFGPVNGTTAASALVSPEVLNKPDIAATDCGQTTFFLPPGPPYRFCGTSAAAPHAAAVAALMLDENSALTPADVLAKLKATARPVGSFGADAVGAGLIDANAAVAASVPAATCNGQTVTITGSGTINGTSGNDVILGSAGNDVINAGGGNDTICAGDGNDTITDGPGNDTVLAGDGGDVMVQDATANGSDDLRGEGGTDWVEYNDRTAPVNVTLAGGADDGQAGEGDNVQSTENVIGGHGNDTITGSTANNLLEGGPGDDTVSGGDGADTITGSDGNDTENGGAGNDTFYMGTTDDGNDVVNGGGGGGDLLDYSDRSLAVLLYLDGQTMWSGTELDSMVGVERANGGSGDDVLEDSAADNVLNGGPGADALFGIAGGNDVLNGNGGADQLWIGDGVGGDTADGGPGTDTAPSYDPGDTVTNVP